MIKPLTLPLALLLFVASFTSHANQQMPFDEEFSDSAKMGVYPENIRNIQLLSEFNFSKHDPRIPILAKPSDDRKVRHASSPKWLDSVGKLRIEVIGSSCTAVLMKDEEDKASRVAITNYHCVDKVLRSANLEDIVHITFTSNTGEKIRSKVSFVYAHGGSLEKDYAILILKDSIPTSKISALIPDGEHVLSVKEAINDTDVFDVLTQQTFAETAAGYSADLDEHPGNGGVNLTYDETCYSYYHNDGVNFYYFEEYDTSNFVVAKNCHVYPGASGGAYVVSYLDKFDDEIEEVVALHGVISGVSTELNGYSIAVKVSLFEGDLYDALERYNILGY